MQSRLEPQRAQRKTEGASPHLLALSLRGRVIDRPQKKIELQTAVEMARATATMAKGRLRAVGVAEASAAMVGARAKRERVTPWMAAERSAIRIASATPRQ